MVQQIEASFLIPCATDWESYGSRTANSLLDLETSRRYEILVCCPSGLEGVIVDEERVTVLRDDPDSRGAVGPINKMVKQAVGEYCILLNDEFLAHSNILDVLEIFETIESLEVIALSPDHFIDGAYDVPANYYPYMGDCPLLPFPVISRELIESELDGVLFNESFSHYGSDSWISYYLMRKLNKAIYVASNIKTIFTHDKEAPSIASNSDNGDAIFNQLTLMLEKNPDMSYNTLV